MGNPLGQPFGSFDPKHPRPIAARVQDARRRVRLSPIGRHHQIGLWIAALFYLLALILVSLFPFQGWVWTPALPWEFLWQPLPRYRTDFDLWTNVLAYIPLGLLWSSLLVARSQSRGRTAPMATVLALFYACLVGIALSLLMESLQTYLPTRRAQWLDLLANSTGTVLGAGFWATGQAVVGWHRRRQKPFRGAICALPLPGGWVTGVLLLAIWAVAQASPQSLWLALGDAFPALGSLRPVAWLIDLPSDSPLGPTEQVLTEAILVGAGLLTLAIIARTTLLAIGHRWSTRLQQRWGLTLGLTIVCALLTRALWIWLLTPGAHTDPQKLSHALLSWLSPGVQTGVFLAGLCGAAAFVLRLTTLIRLAVVLTALGVLLANGLPSAGYEAALTASWALGQWFNLRGLAALSATAWPILVIIWLSLVLLALRRSQSPGHS